MDRQQAPMLHAHGDHTDSLSSVDCAVEFDSSSQQLGDVQTLVLANPAWHPDGLVAAFDGPMGGWEGCR